MNLPRSCRTVSVCASLVIVLALLVPVSAAASAPLLTTSLVASGAKQTVENGVEGVEVNYTNTLIGPNSFCFYFSLLNTSGETLEVSYTCISGVSSTTISQFFPLNSLSAGSYAANLFVSTPSGVPLSTETGVGVSIQ